MKGEVSLKKSKYKVWGLIIIVLLSYLPGVSYLSTANKAYAATAKVYAPTDLRMAPASNTEDSVVLVWEKPLVYSNIVNYEIYNSDGVLVGKTNKTYYKVLGLT